MIFKVFVLISYHLKSLYNSFFWLCFQILRENFKNYLSFQKSSKKLVILANGPSLKNVDIANVVKEMDVCVVNDFCKSDLFWKIKPRIYVLADPLYFNEEMRETELETIKSLMRVKWSLSLLVPFSVYKIAKDKISNSYIQICPYHTNPYQGWDNIRFLLYDKGLSMPRIQNVLIPSIFCAINMGYRCIEIYGVDHSWTQDIRVDSQNRVCLTDSHFYDQEKISLNPWKKCTGEQYKMHEILRDLAYMFEGYHLLREYANRNNCVICNMTSNSFIDAFERNNKLD